MNRILITALSVLVFTHCSSQPSPPRGEFATESNGLMYGNNDMNALRFIVDSLNLRFKTCDLNKTYYTKEQTHSQHIYFTSESNDLALIIKDLHKTISFTELRKKYSSLIKTVDTSKFIIRAGKELYLSGKPGNGYNEIGDSENKSFESHSLKGRWVYTYEPKGKYSDYYSLDCYFFPNDWQRRAVPGEYARLIQYVDCMIDTSAYVFLTDKYDTDRTNKNEKAVIKNITRLSKYINDKMGKNSKKPEQALTEIQIAFAENELKEDVVFKELLANTIDDYANKKVSNFQLESLAEQFGLFDKALVMKRCRRVRGMCSQDNSPRLHARDIAILAARSHSWDIFLRAHLDIMNDRFDRLSDGSYAWDGRKTYLKELEELNLNIVDLMLGLTLRAENVANNHYYGTIWRMGRALTESKEKEVFEQKAITMMKDDRLDEFNRGLVFLLYRTYIDYLDQKDSIQKTQWLKDNINSFPEFMKSSIASLDTTAQRNNSR